jgi:hypothetical protein
VAGSKVPGYTPVRIAVAIDWNLSVRPLLSSRDVEPAGAGPGLPGAHWTRRQHRTDPEPHRPES